jgi:hypothetical protein
LRLFDHSGPRTGRPWCLRPGRGLHLNRNIWSPYLPCTPLCLFSNPHAWSVSTLQRRQCGKSRKGLHYTAESHFICLDSHPFADTTEYYRHAFSPLYTFTRFPTRSFLQTICRRTVGHPYAFSGFCVGGSYGLLPYKNRRTVKKRHYFGKPSLVRCSLFKSIVATSEVRSNWISS